MKFVARPYQQQAIDMGMRIPRLALLLDVGLGKTSVAATAMLNLLDTCEVSKWLVLAPLKVCQTAWPSEFAKWDHLRRANVSRLDSLSQIERKRRLRNPRTDIFIINHDQLKWLVETLEGDWPFDGVVLDESSKFKDPGTVRFKLLKRVAGRINRMMLLTGSPVAQGLLGLWPQMYLVDFGQRLGRTMLAYQQTYFRPAGFKGYGWEPLPGAKELIEEKVSDVCLTMRGADHLDMPPVIENVIRVELAPKVMELYRKLAADMILELGESPVIAVNAAVLTNKLGQVADGFAYSSDLDGTPGTERQVIEIHDTKLDAVQDFLDERQGAPFLLAYRFLADAARLSKRFGKQIEFFDGSRSQFARWRKQEIPMLGIQPQSAGHGVDGLQHGTNTVLWLSPPWSREQYDQLNGRVVGARQVGTPFEKEPGMIHMLVANHTVDEDALLALSTRGITQTSFLNSLRDRFLSGEPL